MVWYKEKMKNFVISLKEGMDEVGIGGVVTSLRTVQWVGMMMKYQPSGEGGAR